MKGPTSSQPITPTIAPEMPMRNCVNACTFHPRHDLRAQPPTNATFPDDGGDTRKSRRLGTDRTTDRFRRAGVKVYAWALNAIAKQQLTDSSNGYRAFRIDVLNDITPHLVQDQYQTAEVVITASSRGWRITQQPTMWHPRASGASKKGGNLVFGINYAKVIVTTWARVTPGNRTRR